VEIREHVIALNTKRMKAWEEGKRLLDDTAGKEMSAEERQTWNRINDEINEIDAAVRQFVDIETRESEAAKLREATGQLLGSENALSRHAQTENESLRSWMLNTGPKANLEIDMAAAIQERQAIRRGATPEELRVMNWQTSSGSLVVPTNLSRTLYSYLEASIAAFRVGAFEVNTADAANLQIPTLTTATGHAAAIGTIPQGTAITGTDPTFARVNLNAFKYGQLVRISNQLVRDSVFDVSGWLARELGYSTGRIIDTDLVIGTGTNQPTGMTVLAGAGTNAPVKTGGSLITPTYEVLVNTVYSVNDGYRNNTESVAWLMRDSSAGTLRKLRDGAGGTIGAVLWQPSLTNGIQGAQPDRLLDYPVYTDPNCPAQGSNVIYATFGAFSTYAIRTVGTFQVESSPHVYFASDEMAFRGLWEVGGNHRDVSAFASLVQNV
jgi:HK97 family phage major capsid protein